jgi:hypothetical protein
VRETKIIHHDAHEEKRHGEKRNVAFPHLRWMSRA